jgi:2-dehydro-3-deoxyphosphogluconate aldolase/(4S)-4-hydroxy-2-oxoglutarate aldolase|tara:strand:- start:1096 stop:1701 length:606 start_codon:yes stop_codon:yes gene_type:complete
MIDHLQSLKLIPVVALEDADDAEPLADALCAGGLSVAEVTLRTECAIDVIRRLGARDDFLLGAGTVHSIEQAQEVVEAGAHFVVTPGFNPRTVAWCQEHNVPVFPGIATPTDLEMALEHNIDVVKFFPAETLGGVNTLKAFSGPYHNVRFIPTGGISAENLTDYLALPGVLACGGSWMVQVDDWDQTTFLTAQAVDLINNL